jgi:hypothetical protein
MSPESIRHSIIDFGHSYNETVWEIIKKSHIKINRKIFFENVATLMPNFKMTRAGPFKGINCSGGIVHDPNGQIASCWERIGNEVIQLRDFLNGHKKARARVLVEMPRPAQEEVASGLWEMFKRLVPLCMGKTTLGLVAASKVLFAVLPEVALPIDNAEWRTVFRTIDYGAIIMAMAAEITNWEEQSERLLDDCSPYESFSLPAIFNVMAMKARPED